MPVERIDLLAPPFKGHLHPILAMGRQLKQAGYHVRVISSSLAQADIHAAGLVAVILRSVDDTKLMQVVNPPYAVGHSPRRLKAQFHQVLAFFQHVSVELDALYQTDKVDLLIADFTLAPAGIVAQRHGIRWWTSCPSPCALEVANGPPAYFGGVMPATKHWHCVWHKAGWMLMRLFKRSVFYWYRHAIRAMGLPQLYRKDGSEAIYSAEKILCLGYQSLEFATRWPAAVQFVGPMLYTPATAVTPPQFVPGKQHVLVTLGTHLQWHKDAMWQRIQQVAAQFPQLQFHFTDGVEQVSASAGNGNVQRYSYINYAAQLHRYAVVIHHGGAGIMYHCLRQRIPALVYPLDYDQFDHAARLSYHGLAIWLQQLSQLPEALHQLLQSNISHQIDHFMQEAVSDTVDFVSVVRQLSDKPMDNKAKNCREI
ncbi:glycosyltransferase [Rheinheimera sp.]|uniref:glycosyltransferase n=1 Tax=Rheinheimera sp. TaxID=1869214 RepID=UPI0040473CCA